MTPAPKRRWLDFRQFTIRQFFVLQALFALLFVLFRAWYAQSAFAPL